MNIFCETCGSDLSVDAVFCNNCGKKLNEDNKLTTQNDSSSEYLIKNFLFKLKKYFQNLYKDVENKEKQENYLSELEIFKNYIKKYWLPILSVLLIVFLGYFLFILATDNYSDNSDNIYYFPQGSFSASFPVNPTFETASQQLLSNGSNVLYNEYVVSNFNNGTIGNNIIKLAATYINSAFKNSNTPEENLSNEVAYTVGNNGFNLISSNATTYNGLPAVDYVSCQNQGNQPQSIPGINTTLSNQLCISGRDILKDNDLYMFEYEYKSGEEDKTIENIFLNSVVFGEQPSGSTVINPTTSSSNNVTINQTNNSSQNTQDSQQTEIDALQKQIQTLKNNTTTSTTSSKVPGCTSTSGFSTTIGASCGGTEIAQIVSKWSPNVALILCNYSDGTADFGSGFLYEENGIPEIITNKHVIVDDVTGNAATNCSIQVPGDSKYYTIINNYPSSNNPFKIGNEGDWGFIQVTDGDPAFNGLASSAIKNLTLCQQQEQTGDNVLVLGYPDYAGQFNNPTVTEGIISGYAAPYYTTSAQIESGNSGGVAIDPDKDCYIGIPSAVKLGNYSNLGRILSADVPFVLNY